jgi:hypothetical protein
LHYNSNPIPKNQMAKATLNPIEGLFLNPGPMNQTKPSWLLYLKRTDKETEQF